MTDTRLATIEDGIPVPARSRGVSDPRYDAMKAGQSVLFADFEQAKSFYQSMRYHFKKTKQPFSSMLRKVEGGWRVWKVAG